MGKGDGIHGKSYAIPTVDLKNNIQTKGLPSYPLDKIAEHINKFKEFASKHPHLNFQVTKIGCGLAGYSEDDIIPLFIDSPDNCMLPGKWYGKLANISNRRMSPSRIIIAGSRSINTSTDVEYIYKTLTRILIEIKANHQNFSHMEIVSGMAKGPDLIGRQWGLDHNIPIVEFPAKWDYYRKNTAGYIRNIQMAWYSTHLLAFWDNTSPGTKHMIDIATAEDLTVLVK
jgi:hypothetical protein